MKAIKLFPLFFLLAVCALAQNTGIYPLATASGTDTYTATVTPAFSAYTSGQRFNIKFTNANTGAATININSKGAVSLVKSGSTALSAGDISAGQILFIQYDGTNMQIVGGGGGTVTASNGLTKTGSDIQLGGVLTSPSTIDANDTNLFKITLNGALGLTASGTNMVIGQASTGGIGLLSSPTSLFIGDFRATRTGLTYLADYSSGYTNRSLPDWGSVKALPATTFSMSTSRILGRTTTGTGATEELTVGDGLTLSSGNLKLGGTLSGITNIAGATNINFGVPTRLSQFNIATTGQITSSVNDGAGFIANINIHDGPNRILLQTLDATANGNVSLSLSEGNASFSSSGTSAFKSFSLLGFDSYSIPVSTEVQAALDRRIKVFYINNVSSSVTGTTGTTILGSVLIPAGTFKANDIIHFSAMFSKSGTAGTLLYRAYLNTIASTAGATQIARFISTNTQLFMKVERDLVFKNSLSSQSIFPTTISSNTDNTAVTTDISAITQNFNTDQYLIVTVSLGDAADTGTLQSWYVEIIRN